MTINQGLRDGYLLIRLCNIHTVCPTTTIAHHRQRFFSSFFRVGKGASVACSAVGFQCRSLVQLSPAQSDATVAVLVVQGLLDARVPPAVVSCLYQTFFVLSFKRINK